MRGPILRSALKLAIVTLTALLVLAATAVAQQAPTAFAEHEECWPGCPLHRNQG